MHSRRDTREEKYKGELVALIHRIRDTSLLRAFLEDLLSPAEWDEVARRWQVIKLLQKGLPQRSIAKQVHVGVATITRGFRELEDPKGGFQQIFKQLQNKKV